MKLCFKQFALLALVSLQSVYSEELGLFDLAPKETKLVSYNSSLPQVFAFKVKAGPALPEGEKGLIFGWKKQSVWCEGARCAKAGGYLLFCSQDGKVTADLQNLSNEAFQVLISRVECEGKDAGTMRCPLPSTIKAMCSNS